MVAEQDFPRKIVVAADWLEEQAQRLAEFVAAVECLMTGLMVQALPHSDYHRQLVFPVGLLVFAHYHPSAGSPVEAQAVLSPVMRTIH